MSSILDLSGGSDSEDDVDYVPSKTNAAASDSSFDEEELSDDDQCFQTKKTADDKDAKVKLDSAKVDEKEHANDLWRSFLNDVESITPKKRNPEMCHDNKTTLLPNETKTKAPEIDIKPVSKVFEFAGETVTVDKDLSSCDSLSATEKNNSPPVSEEKPPCVQKKRGLDSVVGALMNKPKKLTVLEKSILDWSDFKKDEGLDNELEVFNRGKKGFVERKRFLERSDLRSFEKEKSMRQTFRKK